MKTGLKKYFSQSYVLSNNEETFCDCNPRRSKHLIIIIYFNKSLQILFLEILDPVEDDTAEDDSGE